jgi:hypothetical protein
MERFRQNGESSVIDSVISNQHLGVFSILHYRGASLMYYRDTSLVLQGYLARVSQGYFAHKKAPTPLGPRDPYGGTSLKRKRPPPTGPRCPVLIGDGEGRARWRPAAAGAPRRRRNMLHPVRLETCSSTR